MNLIDFHCDTASGICRRKALLADNDLDISLDKLKTFNHCAQVMAIFIPHNLSDADGLCKFHEIYGYYMSQIASNADRAVSITDGRRIEKAWNEGRNAFILGLEDARILQGDITKLDDLYKKGLRIAVLMWSGETCIGGSHNTDTGLTDFGREVTRRCFELGIIPDVSHASEQTASDMIEIAMNVHKPLIASHSDSYAVCSHSRNLRDRHFEAIRDLGGVVGLSLCPSHLSEDGNADVDSVMKHAEHYLSLGGENTLVMGCDLDGTDLPDGFHDVRDLTKIADKMAQTGYSDELINKIFWKNAKTFLENNIH